MFKSKIFKVKFAVCGIFLAIFACSGLKTFAMEDAPKPLAGGEIDGETPGPIVDLNFEKKNIKEKLDNLRAYIGLIKDALNLEFSVVEAKKNLDFSCERCKSNVQELKDTVNNNFYDVLIKNKKSNDFIKFINALTEQLNKFLKQVHELKDEGKIKNCAEIKDIKVIIGNIKNFVTRIESFLKTNIALDKEDVNENLNNNNINLNNNIIVNEVNDNIKKDVEAPVQVLSEYGVLDLIMYNFFKVYLLRLKLDEYIKEVEKLKENSKIINEKIVENYMKMFFENVKLLLDSLKYDVRFNKNENYVTIKQNFEKMEKIFKEKITENKNKNMHVYLEVFKNLKGLLNDFEILADRLVKDIIDNQPEYKKLYLKEIYRKNLEIFKDFLYIFEFVSKEYLNFLVGGNCHVPDVSNELSEFVEIYTYNFAQYLADNYNEKGFNDYVEKFKDDKQKAIRVYNNVTRKIDLNVQGLLKKVHSGFLKTKFNDFVSELKQEIGNEDLKEVNKDKIDKIKELYKKYFHNMYVLLNDIVTEDFYISFNSIFNI